RPVVPDSRVPSYFRRIERDGEARAQPPRPGPGQVAAGAAAIAFFGRSTGRCQFVSGRFRVIIADFITGDLEPERRILGDIADVTACDAYRESDLIGKVESADAIMLYHNISITQTTIERLQNCKLIVRCGVGYDN